MKAKIMIIDDEIAIRSSLSAVLQTYGFSIGTYATATDAMDELASFKPDCVIMDVRMPGVDGMVAQRMISEEDDATPVIMITGHADISMAVLAMKNGAYDFIEKPIDDEKLVASISAALASKPKRSSAGPEVEILMQRFGLLTKREKLIAQMVAEGFSTYSIAANLGISSRTVDHHRASLMAKMQATSLPQLIRFLIKIPEGK